MKWIMLIQTCDFFFFLWTTKEYNLKNVGNQIIMITIDFHYMDRKEKEKKKTDISQKKKKKKCYCI